MSDRAVYLLAVVTGLGAVVAVAVHPLIGVALLLLGLGRRRATLVILACGLLASSLSARAEEGAQSLRARRFTGWVTLLDDPAPAPGGVKVVVRIDGRHVEAWAQGVAAFEVGRRLAGEQLAVSGVIRPVPEARRRRDAHRHVVGRLAIGVVHGAGSGSPLHRTANWLHRTLARGARSLPLSERGLYLGFVVGDTRLLGVDTAALFQRVGLTHLLAVSGANVAFVLAAAAPLLRRLRMRGRALGALAVIGFFATVTRFEPSVLRASAMAALAVLAQASGRPASGLRLLALATTALVILDPFLVWSIGFRLSVGASLGILALAAPIGRRCPGPRWLAEPLSVTAAAQIGVAPVAIPVFGGLPVAALPANLLVAPVVGPLMMWGLVAGTIAGALGERAAGVLHVPTHLLISWVRLVARGTDALPSASIGAPAATASAAVVLVVIAVRWRRLRRRLGSPPWRSSSATPASTSRLGRS